MAQIKSELVGHQTQWQALMDLAHHQRIPSAMGFIGPSGVGKKKVALAFTQYLVCSQRKNDEACGACGPCLRVEQGQSESLILLEAAGEQFKVDQIQSLKHSLSLQALGSHRVVILDEAERLNAQSANALLKMIEEPPDKTHFILITSSLSTLLPTIRSRLFAMRFFKLSALEQKQLGRSEEWESAEGEAWLETMAQALDALKSGNLEAWIEHLGEFKEREAAQRMVRWLQLYFRDQIHLEFEGSQSTKLPISSKIRWNNSDVYTLVHGWKKAYEMERLIAQNSDRSLLFLNYFHEVSP